MLGAPDRHLCAQGSLVTSDVFHPTCTCHPQGSLVSSDVLRRTCTCRPAHCMQAARRTYEYDAWCWDGTTLQCCGAAPWVTQRIAASNRALADFYEQVTQQVGIWRRGSAGAAAVIAQPASCLAAGRTAQPAA